MFIALGTAAWSYGSDSYYGHSLTATALQPVMNEALTAGIKVIDTALSYSNGESEKLIRDTLLGHPRSSYQLYSKFSPWLGISVAESIRHSLDNLGTDYLDLYWLHDASNSAADLREIKPFLDSGVIRAVGVSNHSLAEVKAAQKILPISAVQNHFSLIYRRSVDSGLLDYCHEEELDFFAYMLFEQGALAGSYSALNPFPRGTYRASHYNSHWDALRPLQERIAEAAQAHDCSPAAILTAQAAKLGISPIIGATKPGQITASLEAMNRLSPAEAEQLYICAQQTGLNLATGWEGDS
ncbi:MAG: aldo/keto reductase [Corynebacterium sp.]|nr:aldo/keto reductase [Corynebacterium sp.]